MAQSVKWCFTLNNWTTAEYESLSAVFPQCLYLIFGKEVGRGTPERPEGTPHLQGFILFATNQRFNAVRRLLGHRCHVEVARGTPLEAAKYCEKEEDFVEFGDYDRTPPNPGRRTDWERFAAWIPEQASRPSAYDLARTWPSLYGRYAAGCLHFVDLLYPVPPLVTGDLRPWQQDLATALTEEADDRRIHFVVDPVGRIGKSWFLKWFLGQHPQECQRLSIGKRDDLAFAIDPSKRYFLFDIPRTTGEHLQYSVLEQLKDQMIFSPKYHSINKILPHKVHVVVFMNEEPDRTKMTPDRFNIIRPVIPFNAWVAPPRLGTFNLPLEIVDDDVMDDVTVATVLEEPFDNFVDLSQD